MMLRAKGEREIYMLSLGVEQTPGEKRKLIK